MVKPISSYHACFSNDTLSILKKCKLVILKWQHPLLANNHTEKKRQLNLTYKTMELSEIVWKKTKFCNNILSRSFDETRADIRKI